ncbi:hypothetical protein AA0117_g13195 [Alternaria alternata]|uniref:Uncharacterized protein n=1 Tax=Alternaria alternata TaxID=5599 RepID=A0A4Q4MQV5_ALTAL|nr:hypothetical protein AA0117_g13195 [Alternaria alternata]
MAIRSKLAELKNQPTLYDKKLRKWTSSATQDAAAQLEQAENKAREQERQALHSGMHAC